MRIIIFISIFLIVLGMSIMIFFEGKSGGKSSANNCVFKSCKTWNLSNDISQADVLFLALALFFSVGLMLLHQIYDSQDKKNVSIPLWKKVVALFSFPYFCWFPVTLWFSFWGLHRGFQYAGITPSWLVALAVQGLVLLLGTWLWRYGTEKERRARNPLKGILDKAYPQYKGNHRN